MRHTIGYDEPTRKKLAELGVKPLPEYSWSRWPGFIFIKAEDAKKVFGSKTIKAEMCACYDDDTQSMAGSIEDIDDHIKEGITAFSVSKTDKAIEWMREHHTKGINA